MWNLLKGSIIPPTTFKMIEIMLSIFSGHKVIKLEKNINTFEGPHRILEARAIAGT